MRVTRKFLKKRRGLGIHPAPKWVGFCETMMDMGFGVDLYQAKSTVSKYITVRHHQKTFKVRFSNHKASPFKEKIGDCDFFVGHTHLHGINTTAQAIAATLKHFGMSWGKRPKTEDFHQQIYGDQA